LSFGVHQGPGRDKSIAPIGDQGVASQVVDFVGRTVSLQIGGSCADG
jgi:hypothetical protein